MPSTSRLRKNLSSSRQQQQQRRQPPVGGSTNTFSNNNNESIIELPLLESVSDIISQASYFSVAPLIDPETQSRLARRALKLKTSSNVRVANATYSSLFFDPSAHVPLSEGIIEGDSQSLLFTFQRSRSLFQKLYQTFVAFTSSVNLDSLLMPQQKQQQENDLHKNEEENDEGERILGLIQVFQQCAFELWQIVLHARTTLCRMPLLLAGTSDNTHMLVEVKDWAVQIKETLNQLVEEELKKPQNETKLDRIHPDILELSHKCKGLLFSDAIWTPASLKKEIEKAEKYLVNEEVHYISNSLKDLIKRWTTSATTPTTSSADAILQIKYRSVHLLSCYGSVLERGGLSKDVGGGTQKTIMMKSSTNNQEEEKGEELTQEQEILHNLQLSLQRIQLFTGEREAANNNNNNSTSMNNNTSTATTAQNKSLLLNDSTTTQHSKIVASASFFSSQHLPPHILNSLKFQSSSLTDKMQVAITFQTLRAIFLGKWKKWLRMKKQKNARIDGIMRKNAALHCLWRFQVWKKMQEETRAARRATYGTRGMRYGVQQEGGEDFVTGGTMTKSTQTLGPEHNAPRFFLKIVK